MAAPMETQWVADQGEEAGQERGSLEAARFGSPGHQVQWFWLKGHAGHPENERADELACRGAEEAAAQAADNDWGPGASDIYGSLLSQATDEPAERDPSQERA